MQDDILIRRAAAKDESAFEQLMLLHQKPVYNICYRMAGNADDALDLSQEVFLKLWRTLEQYQFDAAFSTWLFRLTQNVCIDFLRRKKRQQHVSLTFSDDEDEGKELSVPDPEPLPEERVIFNEKQAAIRAAMNALPVDFREILQLRVVQELPYEQIAQIMDCCDLGEYFIPTQVGLPEQRFGKYDLEEDHCWFELAEDGFEETTKPATVEISAEQLVENFAAAKEHWNDTAFQEQMNEITL